MQRPATALVVMLLAVCAAAQAAPRPHLFPTTREGIHLAQIFNYGILDPNEELGKIDIVWGAQAPVPKGIVNSSYVAFDRDNPYQGAPHTLAYWKSHHPDWIEYRCDRKHVAYEFGEPNVPLDIANGAVVDYQWSASEQPALAAGFSGIAFDNLNLSNGYGRCGHFDLQGHWVQQFTGNPGDPAYQQAVLSWTQTQQARIHAFSPSATIWINFSYDGSASYAKNLALVTSVDLWLDEGGVTNYGTLHHNIVSPAEWAAIHKTVAAAQAAGLCYELNGEEPSPTPLIDQRERLWNVANYLLFKGDCTYAAMSGFSFFAKQQDYGRLILFPEYALAVGHPTGAATRDGNVWMRQFSHGLTVVNPSYNAASLSLPQGKYLDDDGNPVPAQVTVPAQTANVFVAR